jgi:hypothetical protein
MPLTCFRMARGTIMEILQRDLGLKKFSRRRVSHQLSSSQKANHVNCSRALLHLLQQLQPFDFKGIITGDKSWFRYEYESDSMFAPSADMVVPRLRAGFQVKKTMITVFFTATRSIVLHSLPQGQLITQDYFLSVIVPAFPKEKLRFRRHHPGVTFMCTWIIPVVTMAEWQPPNLIIKGLDTLNTHHNRQI